MTPSRPPESPPPSGLRNPPAAVRGVGAGALCAEALAMLLAIQPIRTLGGGPGWGGGVMDKHVGAAIGVVVALAVVLLVLAGLLRRGWAWYTAAAVQVLLLPAGVLHWSLAALGIVFGLVWVYVIYVRRRVLGSRAGPQPRR